MADIFDALQNLIGLTDSLIQSKKNFSRYNQNP